jgi:hypothetical protein
MCKQSSSPNFAIVIRFRTIDLTDLVLRLAASCQFVRILWDCWPPKRRTKVPVVPVPTKKPMKFYFNCCHTHTSKRLLPMGGLANGTPSNAENFRPS